MQRYEHPLLTVIAKVFSFFGAETFYIAFLSLMLWTVEWRFGMLFGQLLALSLTTGNFMKVRVVPRFCLPRI